MNTGRYLMDTHARIAAVWGARALALLLGALAGGCGNLTVGGFGEATVVVSGDAPDSGPRRSLEHGMQGAVLETASFPASSSDRNEPEGEIEVEFTLLLVSEAGGVLPLGDDEVRVRLDLRGRTEQDPIERQLVPAAHYAELRIVFTEIEVRVDSGLVVGGVPVVGRVEVEMDDVALLVSRSIDLEVRPREHVVLVVDLNAPAWLAAVDPLTRSVDAGVFAGLLDVRVR